MEIRLDLGTDADTVQLICAAWSIVHDIRAGRVPNQNQIADELEAMLKAWGDGVRNEDQAITVLIDRIRELTNDRSDKEAT